MRRGERDRPGFNADESPLHRLATRKTPGGNAFLASHEADAGERLRSDFTRAGLTPSITQRWDSAARTQGSGRGAGDLGDAAIDARGRIDAALTAIGPELGSLVLDVCCFLKGLETVERERQWPARSAKLLLKTGLAALARHYGFKQGVQAGDQRIRRWKAPDDSCPPSG